ncbi:5096_t:CDS:2, partial [Funneliformis caledonium]
RNVITFGSLSANDPVSTRMINLQMKFSRDNSEHFGTETWMNQTNRTTRILNERTGDFRYLNVYKWNRAWDI